MLLAKAKLAKISFMVLVTVFVIVNNSHIVITIAKPL
jgi:hypothetical protein